MLISPAYAQGAGGGGGFELFIPLILIFVVFWFFLIRPQQKKMKEHQSMLGSIRRHDKVVTGGGIIGTVTKVSGENEENLTVEIAENVRVKVLRGTISSVLSKTEPASGKDKSSASKPAEADDKKDSLLGKLGLK